MTDELTEAEFNKTDRDALNRALHRSLNGADRRHAHQVRDKLKENGWWEAVSTAVYHQQYENLGLNPWQSPPCFDDGGDSSQLLRRMLSFSVSQWEPDPIAAINAKQK